MCPVEQFGVTEVSENATLRAPEPPSQADPAEIAQLLLQKS
jgi:hypothetical protein